MSIKSRTIGTGITREKITQFVEPLTPQEKREWLQLSRELSREETYEGLYLKPLEAWARKVLEEAGLARSEDSQVSLMKLPFTDREGTIPAGENQHPITERDSHEGYAIRFLRFVVGIRYLLKRNRRGDAEEAARLGIELGMLITESRMQFSWEQPAISDRRRAEALEIARDRHNLTKRAEAEQKQARWREKAKGVWLRHPSWGALKVAEEIAQGWESPNYIRQKISSGRPSSK